MKVNGLDAKLECIQGLYDGSRIILIIVCFVFKGIVSGRYTHLLNNTNRYRSSDD